MFSFATKASALALALALTFLDSSGTKDLDSDAKHNGSTQFTAPAPQNITVGTVWIRVGGEEGEWTKLNEEPGFSITGNGGLTVTVTLPDDFAAGEDHEYKFGWESTSNLTNADITTAWVGP